jgi:hypothetical protein
MEEKQKAVLLGWGEDAAPPCLLRIRIRGERIPFLIEKPSRER